MTDIQSIISFLSYSRPTDALELLFWATLSGVLLWYLARILHGISRLFKLTFFETFIASQARPFNVLNLKEGAKRILLVGDSTAVGAGASLKEETIAGRLAHDFPHAGIVNLGIHGARTKDVLRSLQAVTGERFQLTILSVGGNDIWHFTPLKRLERTLRELIQRAKTVSDGPVFVLLYNNIGSSPIFPAFIRGPLMRRGELVQGLFHDVTKQEKVDCIELFAKEEDNPFIKNPNYLFAPDGIHPSSEGYRLWYNRMWRLLVNQGYASLNM